MTELEQKVLDEVSLEVPWSLIMAFSEIVRESPVEVNRAADVLTEHLRRHDLPVIIYEPDLYLSIPRGAHVKAAGSVLRAKAPSYSANVPSGVAGELVYVPSTYATGSDDIFKSLDATATTKASVAGKIVLSEGYANPANASQFEAWGALGVIAINPGRDIHWGTCTTIWGNPGLKDLPRKPRIPVVAVNRADGDRLIALADKPQHAVVVAEMDEGWYRSKIPVVEIRGSEEPEKFVLLHGHYDSWDIGIGDNATGNATMLEVARVLRKHQDMLKRTVRIAWWPGHSTGRYAGSTWYADQFAIDLEENCVAQVNCDSPGCRWATMYKDVSLTSETEAFAAQVIRDVTGQPLHAERAHQAGDYSFNNIGISSYFMLLSTMPDELRAEKGYYAVGGCGGNIAWHTEHDTLEIVDKEILVKDIKIYLLAVLRNANAEILPFDWRNTTHEFKNTLRRYQSAAGKLFDFSPVAQELEALHEGLEAFYSDIEAGLLSAKEANRVILELARLLIPINFTREPRFWHDPALTVPPLPDIALATELTKLPKEHLAFAIVDLIRGQNRVVSTLRKSLRTLQQITKPQKSPPSPEMPNEAV